MGSIKYFQRKDSNFSLYNIYNMRIFYLQICISAYLFVLLPKGLPMKRYISIICFVLLAFVVWPFEDVNAATRNPKAVAELLNRIGGKGTSKRIETLLDESLAQDGHERFLITTAHGKPQIKGSSLSAITTGINWYLNHYARVNLSWNQLTTDLTHVHLPLPEKEEVHTTTADYRYYLNYCTFGYSMATWTWERWQQEIDWMALHGINMPLQIVGLEAVWREFLMQDCHYSEADAEAFVPGPAFTAWWGMNNLEGWGGDGNGVECDAWYLRQADLGRKICDRERELGMQPVLPGFSGMVPSNFEVKTGIQTEKANLWCQFQRPAILDPTCPEFAEVAQHYYARLHEVMGNSRYYSMDPFHEGGTISSGRYSEAYKAMYEAMNKNAGPDTKWVIQQWQWTDFQASSLTATPPGRLIVLDLFSDGQAHFERFGGYRPQEAIYCTIPNFGGRTGFMGRLPKMAEGYFQYKAAYPTLHGIGTAPEAIESVPVVYDLLFELPWMATQPNVEQWIREYALCRYGTYNADAEQAWLGILHTAMNETTSLQGPHEAVMCARPSLEVQTVSTWGGTHIFYDREAFTHAVQQLMTSAATIGTSGSLGAQNMSYDLCDLTRQVMSDYSMTLLEQIRQAHEAGNTARFNTLKDQFLQLILDTDRLLGTNRLFRLGRWTTSARAMADETMKFMNNGRKAKHAQSASFSAKRDALADWLEYANARTLITTWGDFNHSEYGGLRDYSYRQWNGMLSDFYYPRWAYFFSHNLSAPEAGWFPSEWNWAHELDAPWGAETKGTTRNARPTRYSDKPEGDTYTIAKEILTKLHF